MQSWIGNSTGRAVIAQGAGVRCGGGADAGHRDRRDDRHFLAGRSGDLAQAPRA